MKKIIIGLFLSLVLITGAFSQVNYSTMEDSFSQFSSDVAESLPFASTIGLNWSDARVRGFPHFGIGLSVGAVMVPKEAFTDLASSLNFDLPSELTDSELGVPLPGYTVDARIGLPFLPFDIGLKLGKIPSDVFKDSAYSVDYTLAGFDIRTPIIKQNLLLPAVSVGVGFNYLSSTISTSASTGLAQSIDLSDYGLDDLTFTDPEIAFQMESKVIDFKIQASKTLLIFTPYVGLAYSYGWSTAGGGVLADVLYNGSPITQTDIDTINAALDAAGIARPDLSSTEVLVSSDNKGGAFRAFGGLSVNLFILKLDLSGMYNVNTKSLGANINARIAF